jgi:ornithine cyclodeaminase/alanine dehydrogenase-like protein (mu-crystallin family)
MRTSARLERIGTVPPAYHDQEEVRARLDYPGCIAAVRAAMSALSQDERPQPLRTIVDMGEGRLFAQMPGMLSGSGDFGAKLISVFPDADRPGRSAHRGVVVLFDGESGVVRCVADAGEITHIRTGCASAVATDVLARPDARRLAIFGCGAQAESHIEALAQVRDFEAVGVWGRDPESARGFAERMARRTGLEIASVDDPRRLAAESDVICTVTGSATPVLRGEWVRPGTHVNAVGSSYAGPVEVDTALVAASRYFVDYRPSALAAAAEFLEAKAQGAIDEAHIAGEIGAVIAGTVPGRTSSDEITFYKSLGHVVQDLASARYLDRRAGGAATKKEKARLT